MKKQNKLLIIFALIEIIALVQTMYNFEGEKTSTTAGGNCIVPGSSHHTLNPYLPSKKHIVNQIKTPTQCWSSRRFETNEKEKGVGHKLRLKLLCNFSFQLNIQAVRKETSNLFHQIIYLLHVTKQ